MRDEMNKNDSEGGEGEDMSCLHKNLTENKWIVSNIRDHNQAKKADMEYRLFIRKAYYYNTNEELS